MPSVAALEPAWTAGVECCLSERLPADSSLLTSGLDFSDVAPALGDPLLSMNELVLALLGIPSIKDIIGDTVGLHRFFSEFSGFRTGFARQTIHTWGSGTGSDAR